LQCHGSIAVVRAIFRALAALGLRQAEPGEFSRRALHAGQMSVLDVEALGELLAAETELQRKLAVGASARLRKTALEWRQLLLEERAGIEALIDFSDEGDVINRLDSDVEQRLLSLVQVMERALASLSVGERVRNGFRVALLGPPNAGKSTLLNALAGRDVAITSPIPGTTRDRIDVHLDLDGMQVIVTDTAGIRDSSDTIEQEGVRRSREAAMAADLALWLTPADAPVPAPDNRFVSVTTKLDLQELVHTGSDASTALGISAVSGYGLDQLIAVIKAAAKEGLEALGEGVVLGTARQHQQLSSCVLSLRAALVEGHTLDVRAEEVRQASAGLDVLVGRVAPDEILGEIFARFCIGK
jgi:tRNA modification GTPase